VWQPGVLGPVDQWSPRWRMPLSGASAPSAPWRVNLFSFGWRTLGSQRMRRSLLGERSRSLTPCVAVRGCVVRFACVLALLRQPLVVFPPEFHSSRPWLFGRRFANWGHHASQASPLFMKSVRAYLLSKGTADTTRGATDVPLLCLRPNNYDGRRRGRCGHRRGRGLSFRILLVIVSISLSIHPKFRVGRGS
jgi:hypothetical protein